MTAIMIAMTPHGMSASGDMLASSDGDATKELYLPTSIGKPDGGNLYGFTATLTSKMIIFANGAGILCFAGSATDARRCADFVLSTRLIDYATRKKWFDDVQIYVRRYCNDFEFFIAHYSDENKLIIRSNGEMITVGSNKFIFMGSGAEQMRSEIMGARSLFAISPLVARRLPVTFQQRGLYHQRMNGLGLQDRWGGGGEYIELFGGKFTDMNLSFYCYALRDDHDNHETAIVGGFMFVTIPSKNGKWVVTRTPWSQGVFAVQDLFGNAPDPRYEAYCPEYLFTTAFKRKDFGSRNLHIVKANLIDNQSERAVVVYSDYNPSGEVSYYLYQNMEYWYQVWQSDAKDLGLSLKISIGEQ